MHPKGHKELAGKKEAIMHPEWHKKFTRQGKAKTPKKLTKKGKKKAPESPNILVFDSSSFSETTGLIPLAVLGKLRRTGWKIIICGTHEWTEEQLQTFAKRNFPVLVGSPSVEELQTLAAEAKKCFFISHNLADREKVETAGWQFISDEDFRSTRKYFQKGDYHWRDYKKPSLYRRHVEAVESFFKDKSGSLLDAGCGDGVILSRLSQNKNLNCFGIDVSPLAIEFALQHNVFNCTVAGLSEFKGRYNYIFAGDLFEHLRCPDLILRRMHGWLLRDGIVFSSFPMQKGGEIDFHSFTVESIGKLFENLFTIESFEIRDDLKKMYIVAKKRIKRPRKSPQKRKGKILTKEKSPQSRKKEIFAEEKKRSE